MEEGFKVPFNKSQAVSKTKEEQEEKLRSLNFELAEIYFPLFVL